MRALLFILLAAGAACAPQRPQEPPQLVPCTTDADCEQKNPHIAPYRAA